MDFAHLSMAIIGGLALVFTVMAAFIATRGQGKLKAMSAAKTIGAREAAAVAHPGGGRTVEVYGTAATAEPLISPVTGTPCVFYRYKIVELQESLDYYTDARGYQKNNTTSTWRTIKDESNYIPFTLIDSSGEIGVFPKGADLTGDEHESHVDRYHKQTEWVIPAGKPVYVLGTAVQTPGGPTIQKGGDAPFIVSSRSEKELGRSLLSRSVWWGIAGAVAFLAGGGAVVYAVARRAHPFQGEGATAGLLAAAAIVLAAIAFGIYSLVPKYKGVVTEGVPGTDDDPWEGMRMEFAQGPVQSVSPLTPEVTLPVSTESVPAAPVEESPAAAAPPGDSARMAVVQRDIVIDGMVAFKTGERVEVEDDSPDASRPEYRYVVLSRSLNRRFRLSDMDVFL